MACDLSVSISKDYTNVKVNEHITITQSENFIIVHVGDMIYQDRTDEESINVEVINAEVYDGLLRVTLLVNAGKDSKHTITHMHYMTGEYAGRESTREYEGPEAGSTIIYRDYIDADGNITRVERSILE